MKLRRLIAFGVSFGLILTSIPLSAVSVGASEGESSLAESSYTDILEQDNVLEDSAIIQEKDSELIDSESNLINDISDDAILEDIHNDSIISQDYDSALLEDESSDGLLSSELEEEELTSDKADASSVAIREAKVGDLVYAVDDQFAAVIRWEPENKTGLIDVIVPGTITLDPATYDSPFVKDNYKREVVGISTGAFAETADQTYRLQSIKLGDSVKIIEPSAFKDCTGLVKVEFPDEMVRTATEIYGVGCIDDYAFQGCTSLVNVKLPRKLNAIGVSVFKDCTSLTSIEIPKDWDTTVVHSKGNNAALTKTKEDSKITEGPFSNCETLKTITFEEGTSKISDCLLANCDSIETITFPKSLTTICSGAFYDCGNLTEIKMDSDAGLVDIGNWAFQKCTSLKVAALPKYTKNIGQGAFVECSSLTEARIPFSIGKIGDRAFIKCAELSTINFDNGDPQNISGGSIGKEAFKALTQIEVLNIPNSIIAIGSNAFEGCNGLKDLKFDDRFDNYKDPKNNPQIINEKAFFKCTALQSVSFSTNLTKIGKTAFSDCTSLENVYFSSNLEEIGDSAFENCTSIVELNIPDSVLTIGKESFKALTSLSKLKLSNKLETISEQSFYGCSELREVNIPMSITKVNTSVSDTKITGDDVEKGTFGGCGKLTKVTFVRYNDDDTYTIPAKILLGATMAQTITMPEGGVTTIGAFAFAYCLYLQEIDIPESVVTIEPGAFGNCSRLGRPYGDEANTLVIPNNVTTIGRAAFKYCIALENVQLPDRLETLGYGKGDGAFESCTSLKEIEIPDSVTEIGEATFKNCEKLTKAKLPVGTSKIDNELFMGCLALTEVKNVSKDYLTEIGTSSFEGCTKLVSFDDSGKINFEDYGKLSTIGKRAFYGCDSINGAILSAATTTLGESVFDTCKSLAEVTIGTGPKTIPKNAFANDPKLTNVIIPRNVTVLEEGAFANDTGLVEIHIPRYTDVGTGVFSYCDKLKIYGFDPSPAKTYADTNKIAFEAEVVYANSIDFNDKSTIVLKRGHKTKQYFDLPGVSIKPVHYSVNVTYKSSDENIFKLEKYTSNKEEKIRLVAVGVGKARLIAEVPMDANENVTKSFVDVEVKEPVTKIAMAKGTVRDNTIKIPNTVKLEVVITPDTASDKTVTWKSDDENICYVDKEGVVYSKNVGTTMVHAISNDDETKSIVFNITVEKVERIKGDLTGNNDVGMDDVVKLARAAANTIALTDEEKIAADLDGDGDYTMKDVLKLALYVAKKIISL